MEHWSALEWAWFVAGVVHKFISPGTAIIREREERERGRGEERKKC